MFILSGIPVSPGIAIGHAYILAHALGEIEPYLIPKNKVTQEIKRFNNSVRNLHLELVNLKNELKKK